MTDIDESRTLTYNSHFHANREKIRKRRVGRLRLPKRDIS